MNMVVGVADCCISDDINDVLLTYALGSCIAVAIHDPVAKVGGLLHFMLPESSSDALQCGKNPYMFADSGISLLFRAAYQKGAEKRRLRVRVAGGAQVMDPNGIFNIGKRNCVAMRKVFWKAGVMVHGEETGGTTARSVRLAMDSGRFYVRSPDRSAEREL
jgi:chemotaxis protein CheD